MKVTQEQAYDIFSKKANEHSSRVTENVNRLQFTLEHMEDKIVSDFAGYNFSVSNDVKLNSSETEYVMHKNALQQFASKNKVPMDYIQRLQSTAWGKVLLQSMLNTHIQNQPKDRSLIRMVNIDGKKEIRGFLSDKYKRLETGQIFGTLLSGMKNLNEKSFIFDAFVSDTRSWIDVMLPELFFCETGKNGDVWFIMGARMSSSDFGDGAFQLQTYITNIICSNGLTRNTALREVHLGSKMPEYISFSDRTHQLDTAATASKVRDIVKQSFSSAVVMEQINGIYQASEIIIDPKNELSKIALLSKDEKELVINELIANNPEHGVYGENSVWKLAQAMTWVGNTIGETRQKEINEIAGDYMTSKISK